MVQLKPMREMNPKRRCAMRSVSTEDSARRRAFVAWTHFQNLLFAQPSKRLFISNSTPGAADVGVWARVGTSAVQILELHALTHVAHEVPGDPD